MATCPVGHDSSDEEYCDTCGALMSGTPAPEAPASAGPGAAPAPSGAGGHLDACPDCGAPRGGRFCEGCGYDYVLGGSGRPAAQPSPVSARTAPPAPAQPWQPAQPVKQGQTWQTVQAVQPVQPVQPVQSVQSVQSGPVTAGGQGRSGAAGGWVAVIAADRAHYDTMIAQGGPDAARVAFPPYCPERLVPLRGSEMRIGRRSASRALIPEIDLSGPPEDPGVSHLHAVLLARPDGTWQLVDPGSANGTTVNGTTVEINVPVPLADGDRVHVGAWTVIMVRKA